MSTFKKILIIFGFIFSQINLSTAQEKTDRNFQNVIKLKDGAFLSDDFYNKSLVFSISIDVGKLGMVDTVIYSDNENTDIGKLFDLKKITTELKANKTEFKKYKNEFVVFMVVVIRGEEYFLKIENGNQNLANWQSIAKISNDIRRTGRRQISLPPVLFYSKYKAIKN